MFFLSLQNILLLAQQTDKLHSVDLLGIWAFLHLKGLRTAEGTFVLQIILGVGNA